MGLVIVSLALVVAGAYRLTSRYVYGPRSARALAGIAVVAFVLALALTLYLFPGVRGGLRLLAAASLSLPLFVAMALVLVEYLAKVKQRVYDEAIGSLVLREQACLERISRVKESLQDLAQRQGGLEAGGVGERLAEARRLAALVECWQQEEGLARVRSLKVHEWQEEMSRLDGPALAPHRDRLERELAGAGTDAERAEALRVQLALLEMREQARPGNDPVRQSHNLDQRLRELGEEHRQLEGELAAVRDGVREWEARRGEFLAKDIVLD